MNKKVLKCGDIDIILPRSRRDGAEVEYDDGTNSFIRCLGNMISRSLNNPVLQLHYLSLLHTGKPFYVIDSNKDVMVTEFIKVIKESIQLIENPDESKNTGNGGDIKDIIDEVEKKIRKSGEENGTE
ncbi:hypothetical protein M0R04_05570 [Candidatus Dojkabacteria bacterium]|nr:hypothetical protein [Candidatus Dojkabacteria bacterium]